VVVGGKTLKIIG